MDTDLSVSQHLRSDEIPTPGFLELLATEGRNDGGEAAAAPGVGGPRPEKQWRKAEAARAQKRVDRDRRKLLLDAALRKLEGYGPDDGEGLAQFISLPPLEASVERLADELKALQAEQTTTIDERMAAAEESDGSHSSGSDQEPAVQPQVSIRKPDEEPPVLAVRPESGGGGILRRNMLGISPFHAYLQPDGTFDLARLRDEVPEVSGILRHAATGFSGLPFSHAVGWKLRKAPVLFGAVEETSANPGPGPEPAPESGSAIGSLVAGVLAVAGVAAAGRPGGSRAAAAAKKPKQPPVDAPCVADWLEAVVPSDEPPVPDPWNLPSAAPVFEDDVATHAVFDRCLEIGKPSHMTDEDWTGFLLQVHGALSCHRDNVKKHNEAAASKAAVRPSDRALALGEASREARKFLRWVNEDRVTLPKDSQYPHRHKPPPPAATDGGDAPPRPAGPHLHQQQGGRSGLGSFCLAVPHRSSSIFVADADSARILPSPPAGGGAGAVCLPFGARKLETTSFRLHVPVGSQRGSAAGAPAPGGAAAERGSYLTASIPQTVAQRVDAGGGRSSLALSVTNTAVDQPGRHRSSASPLGRRSQHSSLDAGLGASHFGSRVPGISFSAETAKPDPNRQGMRLASLRDSFLFPESGRSPLTTPPANSAQFPPPARPGLAARTSFYHHAAPPSIWPVATISTIHSRPVTIDEVTGRLLSAAGPPCESVFVDDPTAPPQPGTGLIVKTFAARDGQLRAKPAGKEPGNPGGVASDAFGECLRSKKRVVLTRKAHRVVAVLDQLFGARLPAVSAFSTPPFSPQDLAEFRKSRAPPNTPLPESPAARRSVADTFSPPVRGGASPRAKPAAGFHPLPAALRSARSLKPRDPRRALLAAGGADDGFDTGIRPTESMYKPRTPQATADPPTAQPAEAPAVCKLESVDAVAGSPRRRKQPARLSYPYSDLPAAGAKAALAQYINGKKSGVCKRPLPRQAPAAVAANSRASACPKIEEITRVQTEALTVLQAKRWKGMRQSRKCQ
ncbi:hypothetical protein DIPPA_28127 [Diplonema papillatum]|nr:hypothetical protein DIPPA_28127 [Diplonema papillatum]